MMRDQQKTQTSQNRAVDAKLSARKHELKMIEKENTQVRQECSEIRKGEDGEFMFEYEMLENKNRIEY